VVPNATGYRLQLVEADNGDFEHPWKDTTLLLNQALVRNVPGKVLWRVRAMGNCSSASNWSSPSVYTDVSSLDESTVPGDFLLRQNTPNPFNPETTIQFDIPSPCFAKLVVYNIAGQVVSTLVEEGVSAGRKQVTWNGTDDSGRRLPSGVYFYRLTAGDFSETKKMLLLK